MNVRGPISRASRSPGSGRRVPAGPGLPGRAEQAIAAGVPAIWFQLRIDALEAAELAERAGLAVVLDRCVKMEHGRSAGSLHWAGMNTKIVTARKRQRALE